ncbi:hypothetical protein BURMUCF1_2998 [Burkholderia multivorans ATCC BAA-247]|uniref:Uncharacterized protein n=1 Tax=Burkholderia multivorans CGD2 TaxID=513052 RepID=B9BVX1_9BURK|nr:hypothetical protein BURMUCGD1_0268 [Burkholderia multivorans CGD1]EEE05143.1 hypothetical protein BURMUCGD2_0479 [Burkholderia multivorans CGD2]EEE12472.1 hypothetical protein BURMUCGD2M_0568 [Burkholderia multivorans CGD2M]EJO53307.1 hypothetical protein BURMUCF1_2998 [Burkholderia multivorans ATCC BAA-247]EJO57943.1 hypothetical protein BURMUCF2_3021 [Burkholderia multivorans CF2]
MLARALRSGAPVRMHANGATALRRAGAAPRAPCGARVIDACTELA